jgi:phosphatidate cytidylyltransferase
MLKVRVLTSFFLMLAFLSALYLLPDLGWSLATLSIVVLGAWEWGGLARLNTRAKGCYATAVALLGMLMLPDIWPANIEQVQLQVLFWALPGSVVFWLLLAPLWLLRLHKETRTPVLLVCGVLILLAAWLSLVYLRKVSPSLLLALLATVWIADSAAYFAGKAWGRRKLAPQISPGKTWEGVLGAWVAVSIYGLLLCLLLSLTFWLIPGLWAILVLSILGDLFESHLKRLVGAKDSGSLLPGHGGVLDRIDGMVSSLPIAVFALHLPIYYMVFHG